MGKAGVVGFTLQVRFDLNIRVQERERHVVCETVLFPVKCWSLDAVSPRSTLLLTSFEGTSRTEAKDRDYTHTCLRLPCRVSGGEVQT